MCCSVGQNGRRPLFLKMYFLVVQLNNSFQNSMGLASKNERLPEDVNLSRQIQLLAVTLKADV